MMTITNADTPTYRELEEVVVQAPADCSTTTSPVSKHPNTIINRLMYLIAAIRCVPSTLNDAEQTV